MWFLEAAAALDAAPARVQQLQGVGAGALQPGLDLIQARPVLARHKHSASHIIIRDACAQHDIAPQKAWLD